MKGKLIVDTLIHPSKTTRGIAEIYCIELLEASATAEEGYRKATTISRVQINIKHRHLTN